MEALKKPDGSATAKIINLGKSLTTAVTDEGDQQPFLVPIGERAEALLDAYDDRQISTEVALQRLDKLLGEYVQARREWEQSGFDLNTFTIYWVLKQDGVANSKEIAPTVNKAFERFPNHADNPAQLRQLKAELYRILLPAGGKDRMVNLADRLLRLQRK